jgi:hypothetical protein
LFAEISNRTSNNAFSSAAQVIFAAQMPLRREMLVITANYADKYSGSVITNQAIATGFFAFAV